jgi:hypothetical protein
VGALLHRWFVEYNPLCLVSAALVYAGLTLLSRDVASGDSVWAHLGVGAIAELYSLALIGSAATLVRTGRRRSAVMLALLAVVFQCDPMLHVETCAYLALPGMLGTAAWLLLFAGKLHLLGRALELRLSRSAVAVVALGAAGLAVLPYVLRAVEPDARSTMVAMWLFALGTAGAWSSRAVESRVGWDDRGRRCVRGAWVLFTVGAIGHSAFWASEYRFGLWVALAAAPLVATRYARRESTVWGEVALTLVVASQIAPRHLWAVASMAAIALLLRATLGRFERTEHRFEAAPQSPYRGEQAELRSVSVTHDLTPRVRPRLLAGALAAAHFAVWSAGYEGGALPEHHLWLDAMLCVACVMVARHWRRPLLMASVVPIVGHLAVQRAWISEPTTAFEWGMACVAAGFATLLVSVAATSRLAVTVASPAPPRSRPP